MSDDVDFELQAVIGRVRTQVAQRVAPHDFHWSVSVAPEVPRSLSGDPQELTHALTRLVLEAVDLRGAGPMRLVVDRVPGNTLVLRFDVDSGPGAVPLVWMQAVFGLGEPEPDLLPTVQPSHRAGPTESGALRVLVVEDNLLNQELAVDILTEAGFVVETASDGEAAIARVLAASYNLVLMDLQMPDMDGLTATAAIRRLPALEALPIVALTANAMSSDRERCLAAGMDDYIAKPVEPGQLVARAKYWATHARRPTSDAQLVPARPSAPERVAGETPALVAALAGLEEIDARRGLAQSRGREPLYRSLLGKFAAGERDFGDRLRAALEAGDWEGAERCAHSLKGAAAIIGAQPTRERAERLEMAIRRHDARGELLALCSAIEGPLATLVDALGGLG